MAECEVVSPCRSVSYSDVNNNIVAHLETSVACRSISELPFTMSPASSPEMEKVTNLFR
jgi:hypothetical protein